MPRVREHTDNQVVIGFRFASDWLIEWCEFSRPITERMQSRIIFNTKLKICLLILPPQPLPPPPP